MLSTRRAIRSKVFAVTGLSLLDVLKIITCYSFDLMLLRGKIHVMRALPI